MTDDLQMGWITAASLIAEVIDLPITGDITIIVCGRHKMYGHSLSVETHATVPATSACA